MAGVQNSISLVDRMTGPLLKMMKAMDNTIRVMERMDSAASSVDTRGLQRARRDIQNASADLERLRSSSNAPDHLSEGFRRMQGPVNSASSAVRNFFAGFAGAAAAYLSIQGLTNGFKSFVEASDTYTSTSARLSNINDGLQTQAELQDKVYNAAQRSLTGYNDMAGGIAKLGLLAENAFGDTDEIIRFSELMGKVFAVSGASTQEKQSGMYQLTQAMGSGRLQGDEYKSIIENAPLLAKAIEKAMGQGEGSLKGLSSEGKITADIIKSSLFQAGAEIEESFAKLPLTFGDAMTLMKNWAITAFEPLLIRFNQFVNSDAFTVLAGHAMWFISVFTAGMSLMFDILERVYMEIGAIGYMLTEAWGVAGPIIVGVGAALAAITAILIAKYLWLGLVRTATLAWAAAQWVVNAAFLANPISAALVVIVAVIALVIFAMITWADQAAAVFGAIVGGIYWLGAVFHNVLMGIANFFIMAVEWIVNTWNQGMYIIQMAWMAFNLVVRIVLDAIGNAVLKAVEWFMNTWNDGLFGVQTAFHKMASFVLTIMSGVASGVVGTVNTALGAVSDLINGAVNGINSFIGLLNGVLGTDLSTVGTVDLKMGNGVSKFIDNMKSDLTAPVRAERANLGRLDTAGDYAKGLNIPSAPVKKSFDRMEYTSTGDAYDRGNAAGAALSLKGSDKLAGMYDKMKGLVGGGKDKKKNPLIPGNIPTGDLGASNPLGGGSDKLGKDKNKKAKNPTGGKLDKIGKIEDKINIADEDLKMLKELADIRSIQNFKTLQPSFTFGDMTVREEADIDKLVKKITDKLTDQVSESTEGVYS